MSQYSMGFSSIIEPISSPNMGLTNGLFVSQMYYVHIIWASFNLGKTSGNYSNVWAQLK